MVHKRINRDVSINTVTQFQNSIRKYERGGRKKSYYDKLIAAQRLARSIVSKRLVMGKKYFTYKRISEIKIKR